MLVGTAFELKLADAVEAASKQHGIKLSNLLCSSILGQVSRHHPDNRNTMSKYGRQQMADEQMCTVLKPVSHLHTWL